ncbi:phosphatidylserine decarboxylase [Geoglobus acetivorans]|uniref:Phosphatidylserine decarboxylase n=1 Tax=Geoglobus acetivorans TaxID=565033 RepID=A0A0A7GDS5_GEOAI|nr:Phosphatidylserine decarboxylase [Geoglobus acetivorans]
MEPAGKRVVAALLLITPLCYLLNPYLAAAPLFFIAFTLFFFRDPDREIQEGVVSPADGRVVVIDGRRIEIFMSLFDSHVNLSPWDGVVKKIEYRPGRFKPAFLKVSENEMNRIVISSDEGVFTVEQIAGVFARRILCYVGEGDAIEKGQKLGMIVFGSRVALEIPEGFRFVVEKGQKIKAGQTVAVME